MFADHARRRAPHMPPARRAFAILLACGALCGCDRGGSSASAGKGAVATDADVKVVEDRSLPVATYVERGVPAIDHPWSAADYGRAAEALQQIALNDPALLPRAGSAASGPLFARMAGPEAFAALDKEDEGLMARVGLGVDAMESVPRVFALYIEPMAKGRSLDVEAVAFEALLLRLTARVVDVAEQARAAIPTEDPNREARVAGFNQMRRGAASSFEAGLATLGERNVYRRAELVKLVAALEETLPPTLKALLPEARRDLPSRIRKMAADEKDPDIKAALERLSAALPAAATP